jgi:protein-tyrosine phosphatase
MKENAFVRHSLLSFLLGASILAPAGLEWPAAARQAASAGAPATATAERTGNTVVLAWSGLDGPVSIYRTMTPEADHAKADRIALLEGGNATVAAAPFPRSYFLLRDEKGNEVRTAERLLPLEGGSNFRDLGGYRTLDGRQVAWGRLYRSAVMSSLTPDDFVELGKLGIQTVCDFRSTDERKREPVNWPEGVQPTVLATDYGLDMGAIAAMFSGGAVTAEKTRAAMTEFYRQTPYAFADQYARMMRELIDGRAPLAFNCSAGKDRTGVAAALILTALGVPMETVIEDYLLSNIHYRPKAPSPSATPDPAAKLLASLPADALQALMGVERQYLEASFATIAANGGMDVYLRDTLKMTADDVEKLRESYLR